MDYHFRTYSYSAFVPMTDWENNVYNCNYNYDWRYTNYNSVNLENPMDELEYNYSEGCPTDMREQQEDEKYNYPSYVSYLDNEQFTPPTFVPESNADYHPFTTHEPKPVPEPAQSPQLVFLNPYSPCADQVENAEYFDTYDSFEPKIRESEVKTQQSSVTAPCKKIVSSKSAVSTSHEALTSISENAKHKASTFDFWNVTEESVDDSKLSLPEKPVTKVCTKYQEALVERKVGGKEQEKKAVATYHCELSIERTETWDFGTIYYLSKPIKCLVCCKDLTGLNIVDEEETLIIDEIRNNFLIPYQQNNVAGLAHRKCKKKLNFNDDDQYRYTLSLKKELKEPMSMRYLFGTWLMTMLAMIVLPVFFDYLIYSTLGKEFFQHKIWSILLYGPLFVFLAITKLCRDRKRNGNIVKAIYLTVWKDALPVKKIPNEMN